MNRRQLGGNPSRIKRRRMAALTLIMTALVVALAACYDQSPPVAAHVPYWQQTPPELPPVDLDDLRPSAIDLSNGRVFPSLTYGIHAFFWWDEMYRGLGLDHVNLLEFTHVRQVFAWRDLEPAYAEDAPAYAWTYADAMMDDINAAGVEVLARLGGAPDWAILSAADYRHDQPPYDLERLAAYCGAVAERYRGRIAAYQVWNEPNLDREWGDHPPSPEGYVRLLAICAEAIRTADPDALIVSAGLAPTGTRNEAVMPHDEFLWAMYAGGASPHFDVLGVHAPGYRSPPEADPEALGDGDLPWMAFRHAEYMRAVMVANGDAHKQIAITEMGWTIDPRPDSDYHWFAVTPEQQGDYLQRAYAYAAEHWRPWVGLMSMLYYPNPAWTEDDEEYWWAIGRVVDWPFGFEARPAWWTVLRMAKISTDPAYARPARPE